jgi:hypothetical protein
MVLNGILGYLYIMQPAFLFKSDSDQLFSQMAASPKERSCMVGTGSELSSNICTKGEGDDQRRIILLGDSHANSLFSGIDSSRGFAVTDLSHAGCPFAIDIYRVDRPLSHGCAGYTRTVLEFLTSTENNYDVAVLYSRWDQYYHGTRSRTSEFGAENGPPVWVDVIGAGREIGSFDRRDAVLNQYSLTITTLRELFDQIVIVTPTPSSGFPVPYIAQRKLNMGEQFDYFNVMTNRSQYNERVSPIVELFSGLANEIDNLDILDGFDAFCDDTTCRFSNNEGILFFDSHHLNQRGAEILWNRIVDTVMLD